jgi:rod shape determining protein RodA
MKDYQRSRIEVFLNPESDPLNKGYNVRQSVIAIGNGGLYGRGLGKEAGQLSQLNFLPKAYTDFIFAALSEATGLIGASFVVLLFGGLMWRILHCATVAKDSFGRLVAIGFGCMILFSVLINIGMNMGMMPVTGIPLPFISAGGTALIINFIGVGILQSIYSKHRSIDFV